VKQLAAVLGALVLAGCTSIQLQPPAPAEMWVTSGDETKKLEEQPLQQPLGAALGNEDITIDTSKHFQKVHGFGAAMTDASAEVLSKLPEDKRHSIMSELFGRASGGLGLSFTRLTLGASDFSTSDYSYDDTAGNVPDPLLRNFSIERAKRYVLPRVREALAINPDLLVMISPWSAPAWMKTTRSLIKGHLVPQYYPAFANYLARTVQAFGREGVPVSMLTIQNEPNFEPDNYPGERVDPAERAEIIGHYVGPTFRSLGLRTKILDWDHNWDHPEMPLAVLKDPVARSYISGVAWHCYEGDVSAQGPVHDAYPQKDAWLTECSGGEWSPKFGEVLGWMTNELIIGASNNWSKGTLLWNLALDPQHGPHTGGCSDCRGVVTIDPKTGAITRNVEYYVLGHASRFIFPGAYRVASAKRADGVDAASFLNPDGSRVVILYRKSGDGKVTIALDKVRYSVVLSKGSVATLRWSAKAR
jgi:glucosylceramidase